MIVLFWIEKVLAIQISLKAAAIKFVNNLIFLYLYVKDKIVFLVFHLWNHHPLENVFAQGQHSGALSCVLSIVLNGVPL